MAYIFWNIAMRGQSGTYHGSTHEGGATTSGTVFRGCGGRGRARLPTCDLSFSINHLDVAAGVAERGSPPVTSRLVHEDLVEDQVHQDGRETRIKDQERVHKELLISSDY